MQRILVKLKELSADERRLKRYVKQLEILANLRNLQQEAIKQTEAMALTYDIKKDIRYQQGREEGEAKGKAAGKAAGEKNKQFEIALNMKQEGLSINLITKLTGLSQAQIEQL